MEYIKDWAPPLAEIVKGLFWPLVAGLFLYFFKNEIRQLLQQLKFVKGPGGTEAGFEKKDALAAQQTQSSTDAEPSLSLGKKENNLEFEKEKAVLMTSVTVQAIAANIKQNVSSSTYTKDEIMEIGILSFAKALLVGDFWRIYSFIFGSQFGLLHLANTQTVTVMALTGYFDAVKQRFPEAYQNKDAAAYVRFLVANGLLAETKNGEQLTFTITNKGREFLVWCIQENLALNKPF